jgi:hypothetical protein
MTQNPRHQKILMNPKEFFALLRKKQTIQPGVLIAYAILSL